MVRWIRNFAVIGLIAAFLLPMFGFAMGLARGIDGISTTEKRVLVGIPSLKGDLRGFTTEFDQYLNDNFGFRMIMIRIARKVRDNLGENPAQVVVGKEGWLFLGQTAYRDDFEGNGNWNDAQVKRWTASLTEINADLAARGIPFAAFVAVDKARAYPEMLPDDWREGERRFRTALHAYADADSTGLIDAAPIVQSAKDRGTQVFYLRDTHWTSGGTYDLAIAIIDQLDPSMTRPRYLPGPPVKQDRLPPFDLEAMAGFEVSQEPSHVMITFPEAHANSVQYVTLLEDGTPDQGQFSTLRIEGQPTAPNGTLVIVGDSFADAMVGHFRPSYSEIIRIHHGAHFRNVSLDEVMLYNPAAVLFATAERQALRKGRPFQPLESGGTSP